MRGEASPTFFVNRKSALIWQKDHFGVKFSIQNVVLRVSRSYSPRKNSEVIPREAFSCVFNETRNEEP